MSLQTVTGPDGAHRMPPSAPASAMTTFQIASPSHVVTCAQFGCAAWLNGWETKVPAAEAERVRALVRGRYSFTETLEDGKAVFTFTPGQECYLGVNGLHKLPWDGRERFIQRGGDWRGNPRGEVQEFRRADDWVDKFANHQDRLATRFEQGW